MAASPFNEAHEASGDEADRLTLVNGRCFSVTDRNGSIHRPTDGTVFEDVRVLSRFQTSIAAADTPDRRQRLAVSEPTPFHHVVVSRPDPTFVEAVPSETYVERTWIGRGVRHDIEIHNVAATPIDRTVTIEVDTDFAHLFDVKSGTGSSHTSALRWNDSGGALTDLDDPALCVELAALPAPQHVDAATKTLRWTVRCPAHDSVVVRLTAEPVWDGRPAGVLFPVTVDPGQALPARHHDAWHSSAPAVVTVDRRLALAVDTALADLASLRIFDPDHPDRTVVAAGAPWFMTLFGRDSLLTSWMTVPFAPELGLGVLHALAELQGTTTDPVNEEEPGKILHELRRRGGADAFAARGRYYGTVDATPLFVMLAGEMSRWGHLGADDLAALWPHLERAVGWVTAKIDGDATGFIRYQRSTPTGLINQGWKDSWDGVTFHDGTIPTGPIALAEVQGYAYAALNDAAMLARTVERFGGGDRVAPALDPDALEAQAERLRERFEASFWVESQSSYALAVTAEGAHVDAVTTNPGHALWCGITDADRANRYLDRIMDHDLFSGWGLRTLSPSAAAYNPLSYHNGSVWPHDTALVTAGAAAVGRFDVVDTLVDAALDAADECHGRPPELFAGIDRSVVDTPVNYPDSCSPQAWASASTLLNVRSMLGLEITDGSSQAASTRPPSTPPALDLTAISGLQVDGSRVDVAILDGRVVVEHPAAR